MIRNQADQLLTVIAFDKNDRVDGDQANITCKVKRDGQPDQALSQGNPTPGLHPGEYHYQLTADETDGYRLEFSPKSATGAVQVLASPANVIYTRTGPSSGSPSKLTATFGQPIVVVRGDDVLLQWFNPGTWSGLLETDNYLVGWKGEAGHFEKVATYRDVDDVIECELTKAETEVMRGWYDYDIQHTDAAGDVSTLGAGRHYAAMTTTDQPVDQPLPPGPL